MGRPQPIAYYNDVVEEIEPSPAAMARLQVL